jgi:membrane protein YdbS with pleckstrin-like domain
MSGDKKSGGPSVGNPFQRAFHICLLLLGAVIALNLAVTFLQPILPWIVGGIVLISAIWIVVKVVAWRRSKW